jgi:hypothetical protein
VQNVRVGVVDLKSNKSIYVWKLELKKEHKNRMQMTDGIIA